MNIKEQTQHQQNKISNHDVIIGGCILICAQLSCASTASCVEGLPDETPYIVRGLWRQALTSFFFSVLNSVKFLLTEYHETTNDDEKRKRILNNNENCNNIDNKDDDVKDENRKRDDTKKKYNQRRVGLIIIAVLGSTLLNDCIVFALQYANSASVMCLCNTTPIWLILYAILNCNIDTPGKITILGAFISLIGAIICATEEGELLEQQDENEMNQSKNESLGAVIAIFGALGGAAYMTATRQLNNNQNNHHNHIGTEKETQSITTTTTKTTQSGTETQSITTTTTIQKKNNNNQNIHPITLSLLINVGMMFTTLCLCFLTIPEGIQIFSTNVYNGFFGFLNPQANPAALLHSIFPDLGGNFGIMISLTYFEPLIVSMVMLTEPLNASIIAMTFVGEAPPSPRTMFGVSVVLIGCTIVLIHANKKKKNEKDDESCYIDSDSSLDDLDAFKFIDARVLTWDADDIYNDENGANLRIECSSPCSLTRHNTYQEYHDEEPPTYVYTDYEIEMSKPKHVHQCYSLFTDDGHTNNINNNNIV